MARKTIRRPAPALGAWLLAAALAAVVVGPAAPAAAASCGGATPCSCGDTVTADRTLAGDPVTTVTCAGDGLDVDPGVTLGLGGSTITGSGGPSIGVILRAASKLVGPGAIQTFGRGVVGITDDDGIVVTDVTASGNAGFGIDLFSDGNTVDGSTATGNGSHGITVVGSDNVVTGNVARSNLGIGVRVSGTDNVVKSNRAELNAGNGVDVAGSVVTLTGDNVTGNKVKGASPVVTPAIGLRVAGDGHGVNGNTVERYATGFEIDGAMRKVSSNTAQDDGVGFLVKGSGTGTINGNRAFRNTAGDGVGYRVTGNGNFLKGNRSGTRHKGNKVGFEVSGSENRFESNRAEYNAGSGTGYAITGTKNTFKNDRATANVGDGFHLSSTASENAFENTRAQSNTGNGYLVEGAKNTFLKDRAIANGAVGVDLADVAAGDGNTLTQTQASRNVVCQYEIGTNNLDGGGNRANGVPFTFDAAGGDFCPPPSSGGGGSSPRPPQASIRATVDRDACDATCPVALDGGRSSGLISTWTFAVKTYPGGTEVVAPTAGAQPTLAVDLAPGEYTVTLTVEGPTGSDTESRRVTVRP